jgi:hypothetical protein
VHAGERPRAGEGHAGLEGSREGGAEHARTV